MNNDAELTLREAIEGVNNLSRDLQERFREYRANPCATTREKLEAALDDFQDAKFALKLKREGWKLP